MIVDLSKRFGGADVRVLQLAAALRASGVPFVVADALGLPLHRRLAAAGHPRLAIARRRGDPRIVLDLARVPAPATGFGVIDAQNPQSQLWSLLAGLAARVPVRVTTVHSQYMAEHGGSARGRFYEGVLRLNRRLGGALRGGLGADPRLRRLDRRAGGPHRPDRQRRPAGRARSRRTARPSSATGRPTASWWAWSPASSRSRASRT